jgi:hypothetical protein
LPSGSFAGRLAKAECLTRTQITSASSMA